MDIERGNLEILFKRMVAEQIVLLHSERKSCWNEIRKEDYIPLAREQFPYYTQDELENIYAQLNEELQKSKYGVFGYLMKAAARLLQYSDDELKCKYNDILRWREISFQLGQDIFTCAFLADRDRERRTNFSWRPIVQTDNSRLHNILAKGMSENHFHLNGSTQIMNLNWISLMNFVEHREGEFQNKKMKEALNSFSVHSLSSVASQSLMLNCREAAVERMILFMKLNHHMQEDEALFRMARKLIEDIDMPWTVIEIHNQLQVLRTMYGYKEEQFVYDYCLQKADFYEEYKEYKLLCGERKFLYQAFRAVMSDEFNDFYKNLFYRYLLLKTRFRREMLQVNRNIGFQNFSNYQDRKDIFIEHYPKYCDEAYVLAFNATLRQQKINSFEARITPKDTGQKLLSKIKEYDRIIEPKEDRDKVFYVLHFPKRKDDKPYEYDPRNWKVREDAKKKAIVISNIKYEIDQSVRGIDACSNENGCRPEVFAQAFRYLIDYKLTEGQKQIKRYNYLLKQTQEEIREYKEPKCLQITYHAGEDFIDIIDGLRAIDECILFCNLKRGDRIGHGLALGIDAKKYYKLKNYKFMMPKQDLLDNLTWFLEKTSDLILEHDEMICRNEMLCLFKKLRNEIYPEYRHVDEHTFFEAWTLRGDKPEFYLADKNTFHKLLNDVGIYDQYDMYAFNRSRYISDKTRENEDCINIYRDYHFDIKVKKAGNVQEEFCVSPAYIELVYKLQDKMIALLVNKGIGVETNPSSNYLIGPFSNYDQHPIIRFNHRKLGGSDDTKQSLFVSINTDDQGVFDTCLENEYAIMARALEKMKDKEGNAVYSIEDIYEWIDYVRQMGNEQSFKNV